MKPCAPWNFAEDSSSADCSVQPEIMRGPPFLVSTRSFDALSVLPGNALVWTVILVCDTSRNHAKDSILDAPFQNCALQFADCAANVVHLRAYSCGLLRAYSWSARDVMATRA
jgi:hypothetical protein